jgi:hypothetical protein
MGSPRNETLSALEQARMELLQERFEERAAILEFDAGFTRAEAERIARAMYANPSAKQAELFDPGRARRA